MNEVISTNKDPAQDFKDRVAAKLKDDIGGLMPDDVLQAMTARAMEEMLFAPRTKTTGSEYHRRTEAIPSWFVEAVTEAAKPLLLEMAKEYVEKFKPQIKEQIAEALKSHNVVVLAVATMTKSMMEEVRMMQM